MLKWKWTICDSSSWDFCIHHKDMAKEPDTAHHQSHSPARSPQELTDYRGSPEIHSVGKPPAFSWLSRVVYSVTGFGREKKSFLLSFSICKYF